MKLRHIAQLLFGISTFIPGVYKWRSKKTGSGGAYSTGIYVLLLLLKGYPNVHGLDINKKFNKKILEKLDFKSATFSLMDDKLPFEGNYFDVINSTSVLEHVEDIDAQYTWVDL